VGLTEYQYMELRNKIHNILEGDYSISERHILALKLEGSQIFNKFLKAIASGNINKDNEDLIGKAMDCLEY
jgi:hypothetical protein